jgi:hypothetical protein
MRTWWLVMLAGCSSVLPKHNPFPDAMVISPGVKVAYTFGRGGGMTYGGELTMLFRTWDDLHAIVAAGPALNLSWTPTTFQARAGLELVSWFAGIEGGPALVTDRRGAHFGVGVSPWLGGIFVVPELTHTYVLGAPDMTEVGVYGKLPLCPGCKVSHSGFGSLNFDD